MRKRNPIRYFFQSQPKDTRPLITPLRVPGVFTKFRLAALIIVSIILAIFLIGNDAFETFYDFTRSHEQYELDDIAVAITVFLLVFLVMLLFSQRETAQINKFNHSFLQAIDQLKEGFALWDQNDRLVVCNSLFKEISRSRGRTTTPGVEFENWLCSNDAANMTPEGKKQDEARKKARLSAYQAGAVPVEINCGGRWYLLSFNKLPDGSTMQVLYDIHELKLSQYRFEIATQEAGIGVWEAAIDTEASAWSDSCYKLLGLNAQTHEPTLKSFLTVVHPEDQNRVQELVQKARQAREDYKFECRIVRPNGSIFWVCSIGKMVSYSGTPRWVGVILDIDHQKNSELMKDEFISTVSHEFRTPLTSIAGAIDLALSGAAGELDDQVKHLLTLANRNTRRLKLLVDDVISIQRDGANGLALHPVPMSAEQILLDAVAANQSYASRMDVDIKVVPGNHRFEVMADPERIQQVFANLISNAAKFSKAGQSIEVAAEQEDTFGVFYVKDTGSGISEEFKTVIFDKFTQENSSDTRKVGGSGLGLAISKAIVENHGGKIHVDSVSGEGATFSFSVPLADG